MRKDYLNGMHGKDPSLKDMRLQQDFPADI